MLRLTGTTRARVARILLLSTFLASLTLGSVVTLRQVRFWRLVSDTRVALETGEYRAAIQSVEKTLQGYPENAEVRYVAAVVYRRAGMLNDADRSLREASRLGCADPRIELQRCLTVAQSGRVDEAEPRLREIIRGGAVDDDAHQIYEALVKGYMVSYRLKDAWDCLEFWTAWRPATTNAILWRAEIYQRIGDSKTAVREYEEILAANPNHFESRLKLAELRFELRDVVAARRDFEHCLTVARDAPAILVGLAKCNQLMGDTKQAASFAEEVLAGDGTTRQQADAWVVLGQLRSTAGQPEKATDAFRHAVELVPNITEAHHGLTQTYSAMGNKELAEQHWKTALQVSQQNIRISEIASALAKNPAEIELRCELARILLQQGRREEAERWLWTVFSLAPEHAAAQQLLAAIAQSDLAETPAAVTNVEVPEPSTGQDDQVVPTPTPGSELPESSK
ncbi:MAG: tetratricopeptide repeat protein [Planctomycetes bacterium]|nr:tetratricopeptide repeat protein [Planctomycetota bacterium]